MLLNTCTMYEVRSIKKVLHSHFADLSASLSGLSDPRKFETYSIEEMVMFAIVLFMLGCDSRNAFNNKAREDEFCKNYHRLFGLEIPHMDTTNELFMLLDFTEMEEVRCSLISRLIEKRVFHTRTSYIDMFFSRNKFFITLPIIRTIGVYIYRLYLFP